MGDKVKKSSVAAKILYESLSNSILRYPFKIYFMIPPPHFIPMKFYDPPYRRVSKFGDPPTIMLDPPPPAVNDMSLTFIVPTQCFRIYSILINW